MTGFWWITATTIASVAISLSATFHPTPILVWNASASVPIGLYGVRPPRILRLNELVVAMPPKPLAGFLNSRGYLPRGVPLIKHIAGVTGQTVCRTDRTITVDGKTLGTALDRDRRGRPLPVWQGCHVINLGEVFLMNTQREDSLDGRYFGPLSTTAIVGEAEPLWIEKGE